MQRTHRPMNRLPVLLLGLCCGLACAQDPAPVRLRGTIESYNPPMLVIKERSGKVMSLTLPGDTGIVAVIPTDITAIQPGSFVGTAAMPRGDGSLESLEVVVFPEVARGCGEGHFSWDLKPDSTMTNATVAEVARAANGRMLRLRYKDGEKNVLVPDGVPIVTFMPGDRALLVAGAKAFIVADVEGPDRLVVRRLLVGRNGLAPPM